MDYLELKKLLWQIGFLKVWIPKAASDAANKGTYLGHYELPTVNLENIEKFQVHPAFANFLSLKD